MQPFHTEEYRGFTIELVPDEYPHDGPRDWDNLGTMVCWHSRHNLGDSHNYDPREFGPRFVARKFGEQSIILPLYLYEHSGLQMSIGSFNDRWDSGQVGFIFVSEDKIKEEYGDLSEEHRKRARKVLESEVTVYDNFLSGYVYGYVAKNGKGDVVDSCWGYYGDADKEYALQSARNHIDWRLDQKEVDYAEVEARYHWTCPICESGNELPVELERVVECPSCSQVFKRRMKENV